MFKNTVFGMVLYRLTQIASICFLCSKMQGVLKKVMIFFDEHLIIILLKKSLGLQFINPDILSLVLILSQLKESRILLIHKHIHKYILELGNK